MGVGGRRGGCRRRIRWLGEGVGEEERGIRSRSGGSGDDLHNDD